MSTAPTHRRAELEDEVRQLERTVRTLENGLAEARASKERTVAEVGALQRRIIRKTYDAVPNPADAAIPKRIENAVTSVCNAVISSLGERWAAIQNLINDALKRVRGRLEEKKRALRLLEGERHAPTTGARDGHLGFIGGPAGHGPSG
ncbi:hypothetical protein [Jiangella asiatica]|uniref:Uncharacterized protein n=1 Tax=Jiangella asiatica TaxID=2530372 RepID=A0A4R5DF90_9ACTN|nr:hypothetical protein [Jiangella asiatica]TDE12576.1 hypothetical protein E1269_06965 [Jiangella asiatica]